MRSPFLFLEKRVIIKKTKLASARIGLNDQAVQNTLSMIDELKTEEKFVKVNPSKLISWIVNNFFEFSFEREKENIIKDHFNRRDYLKNLLKDAKTDDEIEAALKGVLKSSSPKPKKRKPRKRQEEPPVLTTDPEIISETF